MECDNYKPFSRRDFLSKTTLGLGALTLSGLLNPARASPPTTHFPAKVKRVIYLFQSGAPSQLDLFDHKPTIKKFHGQNLPDSVRKGQRLTGMSAGQT